MDQDGVAEFSLPLRVYIEDTDAGGIVYYVNYLKFMERARTELMRALGFDKPAIVNEQNLLVVHSASARYLSPARLDDQLVATAQVTKLAKASMVFRQQIKLGAKVLCDGEITVACVRKSTMKACAIPDDMRLAVQHWMESVDL